MNPSFEDSIKEYVSKHSPKVIILTPCQESVCGTNYITSLMNTTNVLKQYNIQYQIDFCCNDRIVSRSRNNLVTGAMADSTMTHMLFIDAEVSWNPQDVLKLLIANKYIAGGICPLKKYNWMKLANDPSVVQTWASIQKENEMFQNYPTALFIQHRLLEYNVALESNELKIENNLAEVKYIGCEFMMIKRETIDLLQKAFPSTKYTNKNSPQVESYALFDCGVEEGGYMSEDQMFCSRWQKLGGNIMVDVTINLSQSGSEHFNGSFLSSVIS